MSEEVLEWSSIPRKSREALDSIFRYGYVLAYKESPIPSIKSQWSCFAGGDDDKLEYCTKYGKQTIAPLIKLGLLDVLQPDIDVFAGAGLKGMATWKKAMLDDYIPHSPLNSVWGSERFDGIESYIDQLLGIVRHDPKH